jgi:long-chain acyl-CoA synthetase
LFCFIILIKPLTFLASPFIETVNLDFLNRTPLQLFLEWERKSPDRIFLRQPIEGEWHPLSYREAGDQIRRVSSFLQEQLPAKSNVAMLSKNCAEWILVDLAIMMAGHISVPIYPTLSASAIAPLLDHSESKMIILGKLDAYESQRDAIKHPIIRVSFDRYGLSEGILWSSIVKNTPPSMPATLPGEDDIMTIMYSSGTTGEPKGVMLTHGAFGFVGERVARALKITGPERFFSYLPLSHIAERGLMEMVALHCGGTISFTESLDKFAANLEEERPTIFGGVPRVYTKFQEGVLKKIPQKKLKLLLSIPIIGSVIAKKIRTKLGLNDARVVVCGAAPTPVPLLKWFDRIGIRICEVYGMTENTALSHGNYGKIKFGSVGQPWEGVECKLGEEGEILLRHPALMKGYYKDEATTASVFTKDGFLRTGDKGEIDQEGFLTITGRIKDQFKTDKAKFISPAPIELKLQTNMYMEQVCVVGTNLPQPIALVVLSATAASASRDEIAESLRSTVNDLNTELQSYERIEKLVIMKDPWTLDNGLLTPSLKLKRTEVEKRHAESYNQWFSSPGQIIWQ